MKRLLLILSLMFAASVASQAQSYTWPYVLTFANLTCTPSTCNSYLYIFPGWYGSVYTLGQGACSSGVRPYVNPAQTALNCSNETYLYAYAYSSSVPMVYYISNQLIYAQQVAGNNGTYSYINGNWVSIFAGSQWNDCYTGALRSYEPSGRPC